MKKLKETIKYLDEAKAKSRYFNVDYKDTTDGDLPVVDVKISLKRPLNISIPGESKDLSRDIQRKINRLDDHIEDLIAVLSEDTK